MNSPGKEASEEVMAEYAIQQEKKSIDFYLSFERAFPEGWRRMHIQNLVMEEKSHANKLIALYPQFEYFKV